MQLSLFILGIVTVTVHCIPYTSEPVNIQLRIHNGQSAKNKKFPYQVRISPRDDINDGKSEYVCGGTLISEQHVLTAAHCFYENHKRFKFAAKLIFGDIKFKFSSNLKYRTKVRVDDKHIIIHEHFVPETLENDIAIISLPDKLKLNDYIKPAHLPKKIVQNFIGQHVRTSGWGMTKTDGDYPNTLQFTDLVVVNDSECTKYVSIHLGHELCLKGTKTRTCRGDSGSGHVIMSTNTVIGITSRGHKDCSADIPVIATNVLPYVGWIHKHTGIQY